MPVSTPISPTVGPAEGMSVLSGHCIGLQRSGCCSATEYALCLQKMDEIVPDMCYRIRQSSIYGKTRH